MRRYDRGARMLADLQFEPFPDLSDALPDLANALANTVSLRDFRKGKGA